MTVYNALLKLTKLRFGTQIKDSGIELRGLFLMKNLVQGNELYLLEVNDEQIRFKDEKAFLIMFAHFLSKNIFKLESRYKYLVNRPIDEFSDDIRIEMEYKQVYYYISKQKELLKRIMELKKNIIC
jgi:hypothetical protein